MLQKLFAFAFAAFLALAAHAQGVKPLPSLHVEGKWLVDTHGNHVVLHGVMDTPSAWFNSGRWGWSYDDAGRQRCLNYFEKLYKGLEEARCNVFRLHLEPAWTNDPNQAYTYVGATGQPSDASGEADIRKFNPARLTTYLKSLYFPLMQKAMKHGMYVVVRPPGVCPNPIKVGGYYQHYLMQVWDLFTQNDSIRKYSGQISIELANEPVGVKNALGNDDPKALHDFFQPIVDLIRANGFTGIIWVPGAGWQANYADYKANPITGYNIGYAVHDYDGWYGCADKNLNAGNLEQAKKNKINQFRNQVPVVDTNPIIITEIDWSPTKPGSGHVNEHGQYVESNYGTWATGRTSMWGTVTKAVHDHYGNISMTLSGTSCLIDVDQLINNNKVVPAFGGLEEACGKACMDWYADYYTRNYPKADFNDVPVSDFGTKYQNPIVRADFPDPDVIRVGSTYYMVSTTMHNLPGATILKSQDMVNWEYCAHPLQQVSAKDGYEFKNNANAYGSGMWACSMKYHNGKFHILINEKLPVGGWQLQGWLLTATNPEGEWTAKKLSRAYYDPGMLFDGGKVYVAQGIGNISICELDEKFNFKKEKTVITNKDGLEGCHFYKHGDYYYIYATYGGWPSGQAVFRSKNVFGPYEEKMVVEKSYNNVPNTIHQGALIEDVAGKWWTIMQEDLGAMGRMPNLQPVTWTNDGWLKVGNNGRPYESFVSKINKPAATGDVRVKHLPTTDVFRTYPLSMQWEWNHKPNDKAWSLFERPGWLRLKTSNVTQRMCLARNILTQRIFANKNKMSTGTVRLDVSQLTDGDRAGICILQDPYACIAVEKVGDKLQLLWQQAVVTDAGSNFKADQKTLDIEPVDGIIYLRAGMKYGDNRSKFYYSLDNETWKAFGSETSMSFNLTVFVGARFGLFCYATKKAGGYADFDWFATEDDFSEDERCPQTFAAADLTQVEATKIAVPTAYQTLETMVGSWRMPIVTATYADKHTANVAAGADMTPDQSGIVEFRQDGMMGGVGQGTTTVNVSYQDATGKKQSTAFKAKSSYFPFAGQYIRHDIAGNGTFRNNVTYSAMKFATADNQQGWIYDDVLDFSDFKYLVVKLSSKQTAGAKVNLYTTTSTTGMCCSVPLNTADLTTVIDLSELTYTSKSSNGKAFDPKKVRMVTFSASAANKTLSVSDMFLSNDSQYAPTGIVEAATAGSAPSTVSVYTLSGQLVRSAVDRRDALQGLAPGLYIVDGRKVIVK